jgi:CRP-like cAMP-binding protein
MSTSGADRNRVLAQLAEDELSVLLANAREIPLDQGDLLHSFGAPTQAAVFPLNGMISLTVPTPEGANVEVALVGRTGVFGVNAILDGEATDLHAIAQVAGRGIEVPIDTIASSDGTSLRRAVGAYAAQLLLELAQTAACNRLHSVEERTARWLLLAADRAETDELKLTHEFLAMMLGVRRASVTGVVGRFEAAGLIDAARRRISLADRTGLEEYACSCYEELRAATTLNS